MKTQDLWKPAIVLQEQFEKEGFELFLVGGVVRDFVRNIVFNAPADYDFCTNAPPEKTAKILSKLTDIVFSVDTFGTVFASIVITDSDGVCGMVEVQVTTFRSDEYNKDNRKPRTKFGVSLEKDLERRDFTINTVALNTKTQELIDPFHGVVDIKRKLLKTPINPTISFMDDPLRILRGVRFFSHGIVDSIDKNTLDAMKACVGYLAKVSQERIRDEFTKILLGSRVEDAFKLMEKLGILKLLLPEITALQINQGTEYHHKDVFLHTLEVVQACPPDPILRWSAFLHDVGKPKTKQVTNGRITFYQHEVVGARMAVKILKRLKFPNSDIDKIKTIIMLHMRPHSFLHQKWTPSALRRFVRDAGEHIEEVLQLVRADCTSLNPKKAANIMTSAIAFEVAIASVSIPEICQIQSPYDGHQLMKFYKKAPGAWIQDIKTILVNRLLEDELADETILKKIRFVTIEGKERAVL